MSTNDPALAGLVDELLRRAEASFPDQAHRLWTVWEQALGPQVAARAYPLSFRSGRLTVAVPTAAWMQELSFLRETMRKSLNQALGAEVVREVRVRLATIEPPPPPRERDALPPWLDVPLGPSALARIEGEVAALSDPELREAVRRARQVAEKASIFRERRDDFPPPRSSG
ncbi:MAG: DciA family protein [Deferrisomatales bacterium]